MIFLTIFHPDKFLFCNFKNKIFKLKKIIKTSYNQNSVDGPKRLELLR